MQKDKRDELIRKLKKEKNELAGKIMAINNAIYFDDSIPAKDLLREQREAMDNYFNALDARILDLEYDGILLDDSCPCKACKDKEEEKEKPEQHHEPNFIDQMCDELIERVDDLVAMVRPQ